MVAEAELSDRLAALAVTTTSENARELELGDGEEVLKIQDGVAVDISLTPSAPGDAGARIERRHPGSGRLCVTSKRVAWISAQECLAFDLLDVVMHAVMAPSEDGERKGGIYAQVELKPQEEGGGDCDTLEVTIEPSDQDCRE